MRSIIILIYCIFTLTSLGYATEKPKENLFSSLKFLGTVVESNPSNSIAIMREAKSKTLDFYRVGDDLLGYRIVKIKRGSLVLLKDGKTTSLELPSSSELEPVLNIREGEMVINRAAIAKRIPELNDAYKQVLPIPYISGGKVVGIKLAKIKDKDLASKAGIREGDIITKVNNQNLNSLSNALKLYASVRNNNVITIQVQRGRETKDLVYHLN
ncbi:MAG: PDZ domain-containing protein [Candidatus Omnitrophica bacterium]|nr:PDZ domain-containing protein [Candidatus Omnitrophota bacterium]